MESADCTSLNKGQKLVRLVEWMQRREGIRVSEIQDRFELDPRSLRRYIADLKELELPILEEGKGADRALFLDPAYRRSGLQLTLGEMISLRFGRVLFNFLEGTQFATDLNQAIDRLQPTVSRGTAETVGLFDAAFLAVPEHAKDYKEMADVLDEVLSCLLYSNPADVQYRRARGQAKAYVLEPLTLSVYRQGLYVFARDVEEDRIKTFALERFLTFQRRRKEKFQRPTDWDPVAFVADAFGIIGGTPRAIVVRFSAEVAEYIRERRWHRSQGLLDRPDGSVEVVLRCAITPELKQWILGFGPDAEVLEPDDLRREVHEALEQAARRYRPGT